MRYIIKEYVSSDSDTIYYRVYRTSFWHIFKEPLCYVTTNWAGSPMRPSYRFLESGCRAHTFSSLSSAKDGIKRSIWNMLIALIVTVNVSVGFCRRLALFIVSRLGS